MGYVVQHHSCSICCVNVYIPPVSSAYAPVDYYNAILTSMLDWVAAMQLRVGAHSATVICGDFSARGGMLAYAASQDSILNARGRMMCTALHRGGL